MTLRSTTIEQVPAADWNRWVTQRRGVILDVREPIEWQTTGVLPDSQLISLAELPAALDRLDRDTPILVVCRSGNRSQQAAEFLARRGFRQVANLAGGLAALGAA